MLQKKKENQPEYSTQKEDDTLEPAEHSVFSEPLEEVKQASPASYTENTQSHLIEYNQAFYRCPSCRKPIGFFSKTLNKWGKIKSCPNCNEPFKFQLSGKVLGILFIPALLVHFLILKPAFVSIGLTGGVSAGILGGLTVMLSMRLKAVPSENNH